MTARTPLTCVSLNVAKLVNMRRDPQLREDVERGDLICPDGMGIVWGARLLGLRAPERVAGVDLLERLLELCARRGYRPYILGAEESVLRRAAENLTARYPGLRFAGLRNGYFQDDEAAAVAEAIKDAKADCLFIAISSPKKERFMKAYGAATQTPLVMGVGGSIDVAAGLARRAPPWAQRCGLEWLFRLAQEPRRLWRRYLLTNGVFAGWMVLALLARVFSRKRKE
jgi:N-acetylglucosaminyldiphosphoundecaprenol N-acetyl-beta-D-mannosaminyltransferase